MDCHVALLLAATRKWRPRSDEGVAVSESFSSVSDTIFDLDIIHRTDMQGNISARQQAEEKLQLYASVFRHAREGIMITDIEGTILDIAMWRDLIEAGCWSNEIWNKRKSGEYASRWRIRYVNWHFLTRSPGCPTDAC